MYSSGIFLVLNENIAFQVFCIKFVDIWRFQVFDFSDVLAGSSRSSSSVRDFERTAFETKDFPYI